MEITGKIMGLDVGTVRTGVALSDELHMTGQPFTVVPSRDPEAAVRMIAEIARENDVSLIVAGMPINHKGERKGIAQTVMEFLRRLRQHTDIPIVEWDERFTTRIAQRALFEGKVRKHKRKDARDKTAAALILQNYLDSLSGGITASDYDVREYWPTETPVEEERKEDEAD